MTAQEAWPADLHAGHTETSIVLALARDTVRQHKAEAGNTAPPDELMPAIHRASVRAVSDSGMLGDPTTSTGADGERDLRTMIENLRSALHRWSVVPAPGSARPREACCRRLPTGDRAPVSLVIVKPFDGAGRWDETADPLLSDS